MSDGKPASVLTDAQRKYLRGEKEPQNTREYDRRIRNRIEAAMSDFALLFNHMNNDELKKVFGTNFAPGFTAADEAKGQVSGTPSAGTNSLFAIAFLLKGLNAENEPVSPVLEAEGKQQRAFRRFIQTVESGTRHYLQQEQDYIANIDVGINLDGLEHTDEFLSGTPDSPD